MVAKNLKNERNRKVGNKKGIKKKRKPKKPNVPKTAQALQKEVEGFTIIGDVKSGHTKKVERVLPDWLANPSIITVDLAALESSAKEIEARLNEHLVSKLEENGIKRLFPVQAEVIPWLLNPANNGSYFRPKDLCVSAPTGSGKTLAYVLPIVHHLISTSVRGIRALIVLPVRDLAMQVYKVFQTYTNGTSLKVGLLISQKSFKTEQAQLVQQSSRGYISQIDILVSTPGKLVDHIQQTKGLCLHRLRYMVIDEADRMMEEINQDWLNIVNLKINSTNFSDCYLCDNSTKANEHLTVRSLSNPHKSVQKLLFSATLSQNAEKLQKLHLFQPKLFTSVSSSSEINASESIVERHGEFIGKFTTPVELQEYYIQCDLSLKPLIIFHLLSDLNLKKCVCFTNSVESTTRLNLLMSSMGVKVAEISSNLRNERRERIIKLFATGKVNLLVCSDVMARGMDFDEVDYIISYDLPPYLKTYIHRVGRTARAGRKGTSYILLEENEVSKFQNMIKTAGKGQIDEFPVLQDDVKKYQAEYKKALAKTAALIKNKKKNS